MSRIGNKPVEIPSGVTVTLSDTSISVKGPKGSLSIMQNALVKVKQEGNTLVFARDSDHGRSRSAHGLIRSLCNNMILGVNKGFERKLEVNGVGYRAEVKGKQLVLNLGFSHPINFNLPDGVSAKVEKNIINLSGIDKAVLGQAAAEIRAFRPPEPYKGKGVKYVGEEILRKVGKAAG
jgi:large subunit ribosomal protein L6